MQVCGVLNSISLSVTTKDRARLVAAVPNRNSPQKHIWPARIILWRADGCGSAKIMRGSGTSKTAVWRRQELSRVRNNISPAN